MTRFILRPSRYVTWELVMSSIVLVSSSAIAQTNDTQATPPSSEKLLTAKPQVEQTIESLLLQKQRALEAELKRLRTEQDERIKKLEAEQALLQQKIDDQEIRHAEEVERNEQERRKFQLYGWLDINFGGTFVPDNWNFYGYLGSGKTAFSVGNINLIADAKPWDKWRALFETRFTFRPDGVIVDYEIPGLFTFNRTNTWVLDNATGVGQFKWGGIVIERAWIEWAPRDYLKMTLGQFFTPYGIWNLDHGTPALIGARPPLLLTIALFPSAQTGIKFHGTFFLDEERIEYALTLSNGRAPIANTDLDNNKALGGRIALSSSRFGEAKVGLSWYYGRYTDEKYTIDTTQTIQQPVLPQLIRSLTTQFDEFAFGTDLQWDFKKFGLRAEWVYAIVKYNDLYRPTESYNPAFAFAQGRSNQPIADHAESAAYAIGFYELPWLDLRPYARIEWINTNDTVAWDNALGFGGGINYRPTPKVSLKAEIQRVTFPNPPTFTENIVYLTNIDRNIDTVSFQAAVSF